MQPGPLTIDPIETAGMLSVPLATLLNEVRDGVMDIGAMEIETTLLGYDGKRSWGRTGPVLRMFVDQWIASGDEVRQRITQDLPE